ncbi:DUF488 domain-containing protein [Microvirga pudoricolor]|uniref:DUF488 domain-containing protein n=1 Tax=Microvirga pudoricolor TaxID=2778729 RepID=UPI00194FFC35|nr:DUF488 domain-containing protein [Microvirga pudoricolor]MBM6596730.1 DUF488 domain-containing protein [Microvirga pudoricolor]
MTKPTLYTIGYEGADPDRFLTTLKDAGVEILADVRAVALSRKRGYSKTALRNSLENGGIGYRHFVQLGTPKSGREAARAGNGNLMRRIYCDEVLATEPAHEALEELAALAETRPICLLCFEREPENCHRRILAEMLERRGWTTVDLTVL